MKFFAPMGYRWKKTDKDFDCRISVIYGPYNDKQEIEDAIKRLFPKEDGLERSFIIFDGDVLSLKSILKDKEKEEKDSKLKIEPVI